MIDILKFQYEKQDRTDNRFHGLCCVVKNMFIHNHKIIYMSMNKEILFGTFNCSPSILKSFCPIPPNIVRTLSLQFPVFFDRNFSWISWLGSETFTNSILQVFFENLKKVSITIHAILILWERERYNTINTPIV